MKKIVVTGGSGATGHVVIRELLQHGYEVLNIDRVRPREHNAPFLTIDLMDQGQVFEALCKADAVVHLAAIPAPGIFSEELTFRNNTTSTFNVFNAAIRLGLKRVVWASSLRTIGIPFPPGVLPAYLPIDEDHPLQPDSSYSLSKVISEEMARQFHRWSGIPFIGLRFSRILQPNAYQHFLDQERWGEGVRNELWAYVDVRDAAQACRLGLEADLYGAEVYTITAADSALDRISPELLAQYYPAIPIRNEYQDWASLFSIQKAHHQLGYTPRYSWRDHL
jgi:nucleoside-diphosphate-sugar epimerase